ncbi:transposase [Proteus mirabilis]|uniref:transposase n=1 Tax=Proteus mirabilis TaxID=584 RepID=UPI0015829C5B|nr:transposase [Proteus mirabilis]MBG2866147.1 transposase [Proteus mirabilis]MBL1399941.1 transposase [Proteus mirabilis]HBN5550889.1 transposase [Proteus mirabilis]HEI7949035.1 transposase [Proteus mirabilis]
MKKRTNRFYTTEFKQEAVALVIEQGYSVSKAAAALGITNKLLYNWKAKQAWAMLEPVGITLSLNDFLVV